MFLEGWRNWLTGQRERARQRQRCRPATFRPRLEPLESRRLLAVFTVNSVGDDPDHKPGDGIADTGPVDPDTGNVIPNGITTLRAAIMEADAQGAPATINFAIGAGGVQTIKIINGSLPPIVVPVTIDGTAQ